MHRTTLSVGHADLTTEELADDARDSYSTHDGEGVAAVGRYDAVVLGDSTLETNRNSFLYPKDNTSESREPREVNAEKDTTNLSNG